MRIKNFLSISLILSLFLHLGVILSLKLFETHLPKSVEADQVEFIILETTPQKTAQQIVEQDEKPVNEEIDQNAKYLSQFNQRVQKETRATNTGKFNNSGGSGLNLGQKQNAQNNLATKKPAHKKDGFSLDDLKPKMNWEGLAQKNAGGNGQTLSRSSDHLKDLERGPQTMLSTREFLYYSYFKRIKGQIQQYWEPSIKDKMNHILSRGRNIATAQDRTTKLLIVLNNKGTLVKVKILGESGVQDLDDAAIDAFRTAAPFPNPPKGIIDEEGMIKIRWDFVLEV